MVFQVVKAVPHEGMGIGFFLFLGSAIDPENTERKMARLAGIEPTTLGFGGQYSIH